MCFYGSITNEFLHSTSCSNQSITKKVINWYGSRLFVTNHTLINEKPIELISFSRFDESDINPSSFIDNKNEKDAVEKYFSSEVVSDVDLIIESLVADNINENQSSLAYLVRLVNETSGNKKLLSEYPGRKKGSLFEDVIAKVLFTRNEETKEADDKILKVLISILVRRVCSEFKNWFESSAEPLEKYKLLGKFNATVTPINSSYFVDVVKLLEADGLIEISRNIVESDSDDLSSILGVDEDAFIAIAKNHKDEALLAIHGILDDGNVSNNGVFNFIAHHPVSIEALREHKGDRELQVARLISSHNREDDNSYNEIWSLIAGMSLRSIGGRLQKFIENERNVSAA